MHRLRRMLRRYGMSWARLSRRASQIVVFGSASAGLEGKDSDIDLLCVGRGKRFKTAELDIVWKSTAEVREPKWLGSELGNHVARYGVWLWGRDDWAEHARVDWASIRFKRRLIRARARALEAAWRDLRDGYRQKHVVKVRRDLQRLTYLSRREAVPATPRLDVEWARATQNGTSRALSSIHAGHFISNRQRRLFQRFWSCLGLPPKGRKVRRPLLAARPRLRRAVRA